MAVEDRALLGAAEQRRRDFEAAWPEVEGRLRRVLTARRVPAADHDDYVQEVAARALASEQLQFESVDDLLPWAATVLRRLHVDAHRRALRVAPEESGLDVAADRAAPTDVAVEVAARLDLDTVAKIVATWSPERRGVLLSTDSEGMRRPSSFYVQRHRLRVKLLAIVDGLAALWGNVWRRVDLGAWTERLRAAEALHPAAANLFAPVAAACALALLLGAVTSGGGRGGASAHDGPPAARGTGDAARGAAASIAAHGGAATGVATASSTGLVGAAYDREKARPPQEPIRPRRDGVVPPVEDQRVQGPEAAGYEPTVEVENREGPQPLWCYSQTPVLGEGCVGEAIFVPI